MRDYAPVTGLYEGELKDNANTNAIGGREVMAASWSTTPYDSGEQSRDGFCRGRDDTCKARPAKGFDLCAGHARAAAKAAGEPDPFAKAS